MFPISEKVHASTPELPTYTLGEELVSAISHGLGSSLSVAALVMLILAAADRGWVAIVSVTVYGISMLLLYLASTIYHSLGRNKGKQVFRVLDHCTIFLLIAGTYTPYCLLTLGGTSGLIILGIEWGLTAIGIVLNSVSVKKFASLSLVCYLGMGWAIIACFNTLSQNLHPQGTLLLLWGGVAYTIGAVLYAVGKKLKYIHSLWHFFVLAGSILHFFSIYIYVL